MIISLRSPLSLTLGLHPPPLPFSYFSYLSICSISCIYNTGEELLARDLEMLGLPVLYVRMYGKHLGCLCMVVTFRLPGRVTSPSQSLSDNFQRSKRFSPGIAEWDFNATHLAAQKILPTSYRGEKARGARTVPLSMHCTDDTLGAA